MSKVLKTSNFTGFGIDSEGEVNKPTFDQYIQYINQLDSDVQKLVLCLQGNIAFGPTSNLTRGENIFGQWVTVSDTGSANAEFTVPHTLKAQGLAMVPGNYFLTYTNKGGVVYDSGTTWTTSNIYLKCSAANATLKIFITR